MKYAFLIFFALVLAFTAKAQSPWYFGTGEAVNLTNGTSYQNGVKTIAGSLNPSSTAVSAPSGSMYYSTSGTIYVKQDAGLTTNWLPLGIASTGSLTTINGQSGPNVNIASGSSGTDFNIAASANTITLNIPTASASNRGLLSSSDYSAFLAKQDAITGGASTIVTSNLTANRALISNGSGKVAVSATTDTEIGYVSGVTSAIQTQIDGKEPSITGGTTAQYWRGDKSFQTLDKAAVGLSNVDNTSDANKPISTATQAALDLKADASTVSALTTTVNGKIDGVASSVDSEVVLFSGATGKASKRATGTGYAKLTSGALSASANVPTSDLSGQVALANGGTNNNITAVNGGVAYSDASKIALTAAGTSNQVLKSNGAAAPTWSNRSISGKSQVSSAVTLEEIQVPNDQLTLVTGSKYLAETGNKNILSDASFEGANASNVWSLTAGSFVSDNTPIDGLLNAQLTLSSQSLSFSQDATLYQAQFADGVQGLAMARVRTSVTSTPIYVCYRQAGSTGSLTSGCVQVQANGKWGLYKVPFILGATSNGIIITSNGVAITGDVEVDDAFVGAVDLKQDINVVGPWQAYTPTFTNLGTVTSINARWRQVGQSVEIQIKATTGTVVSAEQRFSLPNSYTVSSSIVSPQLVGRVARNTSATTYFSSSVIAAPSNAYLNFGSQTSTTNEYTINSASSVFGNSESFSLFATVPVNELQGSSSVYSASNADTDWASCGHTTSDFTGFGTVTNIETQCKRDGGDLLMRGKFTSGASTAVEARLALRLGGVALNTASSAKIPSIASAGKVTRVAASANVYHVLNAASLGYVTFSYNASSAIQLTSQTGSAISSSGDVFSFENVRIPISGWENSNIIIGTFNEVMTTPNITKPKTVYYNFGGASATLSSPTVCAASPCVEVWDPSNVFSPPTRISAGNYGALTIANGTFAPSSPIKCDCNGYSISNNARDCYTLFNTGQNTWITNSSGGYVADLFTGTVVGTGTDSFVSISCEGQAP